ncbi:ribonuclease H-like domain-containing protein [Tanacetum coccineum]
MAIMIGSLDQGNPLHLHSNDSNCAFIVSVKLTGVDNYRIWASAMKLALQIKHKMGFVKELDVYLGHVFSDDAESVWKELQETYDRIDGSIVFNLLQKINTFKQGGLPNLKRGKILGTGNEFVGLYLFDYDCPESAMCVNSKFLVCHVSKDVWHNRLGHPANQGPYKVVSRDGFRYFLIVVDDFSRAV